MDSAHNQGTVFSCLKSGQGGEVISGGDYTVVLKRNIVSVSLPLPLKVLKKKVFEFTEMFTFFCCANITSLFNFSFIRTKCGGVVQKLKRRKNSIYFYAFRKTVFLKNRDLALLILNSGLLVT